MVNGLENLLDWVANQGFAIAVAVYLLVRLEQKLDKLIDLVERVIEK
ncbi:unnamed protein product [marine sediment metagenome]|uniref:YvrJ family protein n=1 Tax=marine sediment metagenome TaxID=412755 RepID=X1FSQ4_9ZZZZ